MKRVIIFVALLAASACNDTPPKRSEAPVKAEAPSSGVHSLIRAYLAEQNPHVAEDIWADICAAAKLPQLWHDHPRAALRDVEGKLVLVVPGEGGKTIYVASDLSRAWVKG